MNFTYLSTNIFILIDNPLIGIKDIARLAGVSIGTVDRVLHDRGRVSAKSLKKIQEVIREVNYKPNLIARSLVSKKKIKLALIVPDFKQDEYWTQSQKAVEVAKEDWAVYGIQLDLFLFDLEDTASFSRATKKALAFKPDGVIVVPIFYDKGLFFLKKCEQNNLPVVIFNTHLPLSKTLSYIGTDSFQSGMLAAELLHLSVQEKGKFVVLHFDEELTNSVHMLEKEKGFRAYFIKEDTNKMISVITVVLNNTKHEYQKQLTSLFNKKDILGIFVSTSKTYIVSEFMEQKKINTIKLVGYDLIKKNIDLLKRGSINFLINQNIERQTELAIHTMSNYLLYKQIPEKNIHFPLEIITRYNVLSYL